MHHMLTYLYIQEYFINNKPIFWDTIGEAILASSTEKKSINISVIRLALRMIAFTRIVVILRIVTADN